MAVPPQAHKTAKPRGPLSRRTHPAEENGAQTKPEAVQHGTEPEDVVVFTSYDGTTRVVGGLPPSLGRATALANERSVGKVWGTPEEEAACRDIRKGI